MDRENERDGEEGKEEGREGEEERWRAEGRGMEEETGVCETGMEDVYV